MRRDELIARLASDCIYFRGDRPCLPHQRHGQACRCPLYCPRSAKLLLLQLSSAAAVVRSTALLTRLKADDPNCHITYLTPFVDFLPKIVDAPLRLDPAALLCCQTDHFDKLYNLDLDRRACAIANVVAAELKKGFGWRHGRPIPLDPDSEAAYLNRVFPRAAAAIVNPIQELFTLCGLEYRGERPWLDMPPDLEPAPRQEDETVVGLYTVAARRSGGQPFWEPRRWARLAQMLEQHGLAISLLSDAASCRYDRFVAQAAGQTPPGPLEGRDLLAAVAACDVVVCTPGDILEVALALERQVVLLQGAQAEIDETYLRGRGSIVRAEGFTNGRGDLSDILPDVVVRTVLERLDHLAELAERAGPQPPDQRPPLNLAPARSQTALHRRRPAAEPPPP